MQLTKIRKTHGIYRKTEGLFGKNAVLVMGLGLPFIIIAANTLKNAAAISVATFCAVLPAVLVGTLTLRSVPQWIRYMLVTATALVGAYLSRFLIRGISPEIFDSLGIYLPLLAVNSLVINRGVTHAENHTCLQNLLSGALYSGGFALVAFVMAAVRELLGNGTLWGVTVFTATVPAALTVFSGFILLAFLGAGVRALHRLIMAISYRLDNPTAAEIEQQQIERMVD